MDIQEKYSQSKTCAIQTIKWLRVPAASRWPDCDMWHRWYLNNSDCGLTWPLEIHFSTNTRPRTNKCLALILSQSLSHKTLMLSSRDQKCCNQLKTEFLANQTLSASRKCHPIGWPGQRWSILWSETFFLDTQQILNRLSIVYSNV